MFGLRMPELLLILAIVVVLFGATKLPQLGQGLGEGLRSFKKAFRDDKDEPDALPEKPSATEPGAQAKSGQAVK
jgi:sec-independent protein translocase protein TatA